MSAKRYQVMLNRCQRDYLIDLISSLAPNRRANLPVRGSC